MTKEKAEAKWYGNWAKSDARIWICVVSVSGLRALKILEQVLPFGSIGCLPDAFHIQLPWAGLYTKMVAAKSPCFRLKSWPP